MEKIPFLYRMIRGAVGKEYVIKHYKGGRIVKTRFPDMSGIIASEKQRVRRNLFREAVVYAKWIIGDEQRKRAFRETLPRKKRKNVYQAALQLYMRMQGDAKWLRKQLAIRSMMQSGRKEMVERNGKLDVVKCAGMESVFAWEQKQTLLCGFAGGAEGGCSGSGFEPPETWVVVWSKKEEVVVDAG